jgi:RNA polymerase sigma-70 factor (ECF subfamily)
MEINFETKSLIASAKLGNIEALNKLFAKYQQRVLRIVRLRLTPGMRQKLKLQSMDIVQEVFMYAFEHFEDFEPKSEGHFLNWLSAKVKHYICDRLHYVSRQKRSSEGGEISVDQEYDNINNTSVLKLQIADDGTTPTQHIVKKESEALLDEILCQLDEEDREIIINRNLEELTFAEIGQMYGKSEDAVRKQYVRAFKKLMDLSEKAVKSE